MRGPNLPSTFDGGASAGRSGRIHSGEMLSGVSGAIALHMVASGASMSLLVPMQMAIQVKSAN